MGSTESLVKFLLGSQGSGPALDPTLPPGPGSLPPLPRAAGSCRLGRQSSCSLSWGLGRWALRLRHSGMRLAKPLGSALTFGLKRGQPAAWSTRMETRPLRSSREKSPLCHLQVALFCHWQGCQDSACSSRKRKGQSQPPYCGLSAIGHLLETGLCVLSQSPKRPELPSGCGCLGHLLLES